MTTAPDKRQDAVPVELEDFVEALARLLADDHERRQRDPQTRYPKTQDENRRSK